MVITAKFASVCPCCNARIEVGSKVEWTKGSKARHVACTGPAPTGALVGIVKVAPWRRSYTPSRELRGRWTGCRCGSIEGSPRDSDCRQCQYDNE